MLATSAYLNLPLRSLADVLRARAAAMAAAPAPVKPAVRLATP